MPFENHSRHFYKNSSMSNAPLIQKQETARIEYGNNSINSIVQSTNRPGHPSTINNQYGRFGSQSSSFLRDIPLDDSVEPVDPQIQRRRKREKSKMVKNATAKEVL